MDSKLEIEIFTLLNHLKIKGLKCNSCEDGLNVFLDFFQNRKLPIELELSEFDTLLFQYGNYNWDSVEDKFELNFTRQIQLPNEEEFFQIGLTFYYKTSEINIQSFENFWLIEFESIQHWAKKVRLTDGFQKALNSSKVEVKVDLNQT